MLSHKEYFNEHADEYYQALTNEKIARTFTKELTDDPEIEGKLTLRLMIMPSFSRRVAMIPRPLFVLDLKIYQNHLQRGTLQPLDQVHPRYHHFSFHQGMP